MRNRIAFAQNDVLLPPQQTQKQIQHTTKHRTMSIPHIRLLLEYVENLKPALRLHSFQCYMSHVNSFDAFCQEQKITAIRDFDVHGYIKHLLKSIGNAYTNSRIAALRRFYDGLIELKKVRVNPFKWVKKLPEHPQGKHYFTEPQLELVKAEIETQRPGLLLPCQILYYTLIRPKELAQLKIENIDFNTGKIHVPSTIAKNKKSAFVTIPMPLLKILLKENFHKAPPQYFIIGKGLRPNAERLGFNYLQACFRKIVVAVGLDTKLYSLYSLKHTGNVKLYKSGMQLKSIQRQNRHSSLNMTDIYFRSMGLDDMPDVREHYPEF